MPNNAYETMMALAGLQCGCSDYTLKGMRITLKDKTNFRTSVSWYHCRHCHQSFDYEIQATTHDCPAIEE